MYSGLAMYIERPPTSRGMPAFGCADSLRVVTVAMRSIASRIVCGPTEQFSPITSTPQRSSTRAMSSGLAPKAVRTSGPTVACAITGIPASTSRAAKIACSSSSRSVNVSKRKQSAPPAFNASICSRNSPRASSLPVGPYGSRRTPNGPTAPDTSRCSPAASRASCAALVLMADTCPSSPYCVSLARLAPKVFVSSTSAPAFAYAAWISRTRSGLRSTSSS